MKKVDIHLLFLIYLFLGEEIEAKNLSDFRTVKSKILKPEFRKFSFVSPKDEELPFLNLSDEEGNPWYFQYDFESLHQKFELNYNGEFLLGDSVDIELVNFLEDFFKDSLLLV